MNATKITRNIFNIEDDQIGVMYSGPTVGLINQENKYIGLSNEDNIGVLSYNIGVVNNTIRRDTFDNLENGCLANGLNGDDLSLSPRGLTFLCNRNQGVLYDHAIAVVPFIQHNQIRPVQADFEDLAVINGTGNVIDYSNEISSDFYDQSLTSMVYHGRDIDNERLMSFSGSITQIFQDEVQCDQSIFIDFPPVIIDPNDPEFPDDLIGMKDYIDSVRSGTGPGTPNLGPDFTYQLEEWDHFFPFLLNEVMNMNQDVGYANFNNPYPISLDAHEANVASWLYGHSLESDLTIVRIMAEDGFDNDALNYLNSLNSIWYSHPEILSTINDYTTIINLLGSTGVHNLSSGNVNIIANQFNTVQTNFGQSWIRSISHVHNIHLPITYSLPVSGQVTPRNSGNGVSHLSPNPFQNTFTFISPNDGELHVYDLLGRKQLSAVMDKGENIIDLSNAKSGLYVYSFVVNNVVVLSGKLIKS